MEKLKGLHKKMIGNVYSETIELLNAIDSALGHGDLSYNKQNAALPVNHPEIEADPVAEYRSAVNDILSNLSEIRFCGEEIGLNDAPEPEDDRTQSEKVIDAVHKGLARSGIKFKIGRCDYDRQN